MRLDEHKLVMEFLVVLLGGRTVTAPLNPSGLVYVIDDTFKYVAGLLISLSLWGCRWKPLRPPPNS